MMLNTAGVANAADGAPVHPLLNPVDIAQASYVFALSSEVARVAGPDGRGAVGAFVKHALEPKLKSPTDKPQLTGYPLKPYNGDLAVVAVVPPGALFATASVPVCVEKDGKVLGTYDITPKGEVKPTHYSGPVTLRPMPAFTFACGAPMKAARNAMIDSLNAKNEQPGARVVGSPEK